MRTRRDSRLVYEYDKMVELKAKSSLIDFKTLGAIPGRPAEKYLVTFCCKGIASIDEAGNPIYSNDHRVQIDLHAQYPREEPYMKWITPIWHPNIDHETGDVCINEWAASRLLDDLCVLLCQMVAYQVLHDEDRPPYPKDPYVAAWSLQNRHLFPVYAGPIIGGDIVELISDEDSETYKDVFGKIVLDDEDDFKKASSQIKLL